MVFDKVVAGNIKKLIQDSGMKQCSVAKKADIPERDLSAMLNGRKLILSVHIKQIAEALAVTPNDLFAETDQSKAG